jgi:hypothetical protein
VLAALAVVAVVLLGLLGLVADALPPESHPQLTSAQWDWCNSAKNREGGSCRSCNDGSSTEDRKMERDKYHVLIEGSWYEGPEFTLV